MENKLNYKGLTEYSKAYSEKVTSEWFDEKDTINGKEILELTPCRQVNLFVIKNLFFRWKEEMKNLQSPYFDFKAESVKGAMKTLMNEVSNHIRINREDFEPLLQQSTEDALLLVLSPYDYYAREVNNPERTKLRLKYLMELKKYVKVNETLLDAIIEEFRKENVKKAFNDEAFRIFQEAFHRFEGTPEDIQAYVKEFSQVIPLDTNKIYEGGSDAPKSVQTSVEEKEEPAKPERREGISSTLNERFNESRSTLNDNLKTGAGATLADQLQSGKIENLKETLTVNQKFMFINKLFGGDSGIFHQALDRIEHCTNKGDAIGVLETEVDFYREWDTESEEVIEFMGLLERKFK